LKRTKGKREHANRKQESAENAFKAAKFRTVGSGMPEVPVKIAFLDIKLTYWIENR
jgi:hypothetical protein